jgi:uncharacterized membrane protein YesL
MGGKQMFKSKNGPVMFTIGKLVDAFMLTLLWIVFSLPVITMGAASTALSGVTLRMAAGEELLVARTFVQTFKQEFSSSLKVWLILLSIGVILVGDYWFLLQLQGPLVTAFLGMTLVLTLCYIFVLIYIFPIIAKFKNTPGKYLLSALMMSLRHLPATIAITLIFIAMCIGISYFLPLMIISVGLFTLLSAYLLQAVLRKYISASTELESN